MLGRYNWCRRVCEQVRFKPDHGRIQEELYAHMADCHEALMASGMAKEEAERAMLERMGDPAEVGRALDRVHKPWLGWVWMVSRWAVILCGVIAAFLLVTVFGRLSVSLEDLPAISFEHGERVQGCRDLCAGYLFVVEHAALWENGSGSEGNIKLSMTVWDLLGSGNLRAGTEFYALDDRGNYYSRNSEVGHFPDRAGYVLLDRRGDRIVSEVYEITIFDVPLDVRWVELRYDGGERQICLRVELPGGEGA